MTKIGIVVGRFQVDKLHEGHIHLIEIADENSDDLIVFVGVAGTIGTKANPLDYRTRKLMIEAEFPHAFVAPLPDIFDDYEWSKILDGRIREISRHGKVTLYASRDSFAPHYHGKFEVQEIDPVEAPSGTDVRKGVTAQSSRDFRRGIIYGAMNSFDRVVPEVTVMVLDDDDNIILTEEGVLPQDWVRTSDEDLEDAVRRIAKTHLAPKSIVGGAEEFEIADIKYNDSWNRPHWCYRGSNDKALRIKFTCKLVGAVRDGLPRMPFDQFAEF